MSRARHKMRASGGKAVAYSGGDSNVMKEAHERKRGGRVHHAEGEGEKGKSRHDRKERARGGPVKHKEGSAYEEAHESAAERKREKAEGRKHGGAIAHKGDGHTSHHEHGEMHAKPHHVRGRKRGGGVGANLTPLSTAARIKEVTKGEQAEDSDKDE